MTFVKKNPPLIIEYERGWMVELELEELGEEILKSSYVEEEEEGEDEEEKERGDLEGRGKLRDFNRDLRNSLLAEADADYERLCQTRKSQARNSI